MKILLIITGSIAAYKGLELIRRGRDRGYDFTTILTAGAQQFITPLSAASLSGNPCYTDLFSLKDETEMGHIRLSRESDLIVIVPASADFLAKLAQGRCDDLASTVALATDKPILAAPGMNHKMWEHPATQRNLDALITDGLTIIQPESGALACGEVGTGRMADVPTILDFIDDFVASNKPLAGKKALVTAGPTREAIDPVRFISNHSSGKQGYAIAESLANAGAKVTLISGPTMLPSPRGVSRVDVTSAEEMLAACEAALPANIAVCSAAVADWKVDSVSARKLKKKDMDAVPNINLIENPDILYAIAHHKNRPALVIGFAAETDDLQDNALAKRASKGCDWIIGNDVSGGDVCGSDENKILLCTQAGVEPFARQSKLAIANMLTGRIADYLNTPIAIKESKHG